MQSSFPLQARGFFSSLSVVVNRRTEEQGSSSGDPHMFFTSFFHFRSTSSSFSLDRYFINWRISPQNGNRLDELKSRTEESFFSYKWTCLSSLFSASVQIQRCFVCSSVYLCLSSSVAQFPRFHCALWSAFGLLRKFLYSLTLSHYTCCTSLCSVQNTTPEDALSLCWCSLTLTLATSMGI